MSKSPTVIDFTWSGRLEFAVRTSRSELTLDSAGLAGPSPVDALAAALAGCMAMDLVHILTKGRHGLSALRGHLAAERAADSPHRLTSVTLHFDLEGPVPPEAVERAIALSREKYCSVWHSLRQDIAFQVTFGLAA
jgi:putative redox protein